MPSDRWSRVEQIFKDAANLRDRARSAFLERACAGDAELRAEVQSLLDHDGPDAEVSIAAALHGAVVSGPEPAPAPGAGGAVPGERVGPYRIEREIGRGGMGAVYLAMRADDQFRKAVAIKVMRRRAGRPDLLQRFQMERQILATLEHPNIARMLDGGTTPAGEPYVVMEYVEGEDLNAHCNHRRLGTRERLGLVLQVCAAVQYAHNNLVVHRDLKPGNILVTREGRVKLLDFGIAKLLDPDLPPAMHSETATEFRVLTPEYASPEQIKGEAITTATDVYALGVLLYELLAGRRPYRVRRSTTGELERAILEQDPERPSTAIARREEAWPDAPRTADAALIAGERGTAPAKLSRQLRGDLDNIILMALRKEPVHRYPSPQALAEDLRRHLAGLPVIARPATLGYRTLKFVRRNAGAVSAAAAAVTIIVSLVGFYTVRLTRERDRARLAEQKAVDQARISAATSDFLKGLFETADPREAGTPDMNAQDLLIAGVERLRTGASIDLKTRAALHLTLGLALGNLGRSDRAIESLRLSVAEREEAYGRESLETAEALHRLGDELREADRLEEGLTLLREALAIRERLLEGDSHEMADSYNNLALVEIGLGNYVESERLQIASVEMHTRLTGPDSQEVAVPLNNLALLRSRQGRLDEAETLSGRALAIQRRGTDRSTLLLTRHLLATIRLWRGDAEPALEEFRAILSEQAGLIGARHPRALVTARSIGACLAALGDLPAARRQLLAAAHDTAAALGTGSRVHAAVQAELAALDAMEGRPERAEALMREVVRTYVQGVGPKHFALAGQRRRLAEALIETGKIDEAESLLRGSLDLLPATEAYPHVERARILIRLGEILRQSRRVGEATGALDEAREIIGLTSGDRSLEMGLLLVQRAALEIGRGDSGPASVDLRAAEAILPRFLPESHRDRSELARQRSHLPG